MNDCRNIVVAYMQEALVTLIAFQSLTLERRAAVHVDGSH